MDKLQVDSRLRWVGQQRWLVLLAFLIGTSLLGVLGLGRPDLGGIPAFLSGPEAMTERAIMRTAQAQATGTPPAATPQAWFGSGTARLGEEHGPTSTPTAYFAFLPQVLVAEEQQPTAVVLLAEPPAVEAAPNWPPGLTRMTVSKLGLHAIRASDPFVIEFIRRARPRVVKSVDDLGWLSEVKRVSPNTLTIGRLNSEQNEEQVLVMDPIEAADLYIERQLERYRLNPGVDVWEGWNEFVPVNNERMAWYAAFEAHRACKMQALGLRAAVGGFSVGVPEYDQMAFFMPALEAAARCNGLFTLHEYNSPTMDCGVASGRGGIIPGAPHLGDVQVGYHALRYRFWYEGYLRPRGLASLPLVISEAGVEGRQTPGGPCNDPSGRAWKDYADWWVANGFGPNRAQAYVNVLSWYDAQLRQDPYVIGATIFTVGALDHESGWHPFDIHDALVSLARYAIELK